MSGPEDSLSPVQTRLATGATLAVDAYDRRAQTKIGSGSPLTLDNQIDTGTGTVRARAVFANIKGALFPNQFVNTRLLVNTSSGATLIPASAIHQNGQAAISLRYREAITISRIAAVTVDRARS